MFCSYKSYQEGKAPTVAQFPAAAPGGGEWGIRGDGPPEAVPDGSAAANAQRVLRLFRVLS